MSLSLFTFGALRGEVDGPCLGPDPLPGPVDPDVHGLDLLRLKAQAEVPAEGGG